MTPSERCVRRQPSAATSGCSPRAAARAASTCSSPRGSGGRAWLGIGAGHHGEEAQALDLPLPPVAERFERLEETLQIAIRMWAGNETPSTRPRFPAKLAEYAATVAKDSAEAGLLGLLTDQSEGPGCLQGWQARGRADRRGRTTA
jgi:Luciferase-like monooxygenase